MTDRATATATATALLALWNDVEPALDAAYNEWHAHEHVPERLTVPGMLWAHRFGHSAAQAPMPRYLTLYGLRDAAVLDGAPYQRLLAEPTPMSARMRPALRNISRWVCRLHRPGRLDAAPHVSVRTWLDDAAQPDDPADGDETTLVAEHLPQAAALPWLQAAQERLMAGRWLVCRPLPEGAMPDPSSCGYRRLPIG